MYVDMGPNTHRLFTCMRFGFQYMYLCFYHTYRYYSAPTNNRPHHSQQLISFLIVKMFKLTLLFLFEI